MLATWMIEHPPAPGEEADVAPAALVITTPVSAPVTPLTPDVIRAPLARDRSVITIGTATEVIHVYEPIPLCLCVSLRYYKLFCVHVL